MSVAVTVFFFENRVFLGPSYTLRSTTKVEVDLRTTLHKLDVYSFRRHCLKVHNLRSLLLPFTTMGERGVGGGGWCTCVWYLVWT